LEVFVHEPENVVQQDLGTVLGIFEITDTSEDSSYIVNFLISVIKKEYSARPKRGAIESFEAALHKANLALSKLAEHGNIKWIGKINALIAVIEKNNLYLSQAGTASAYLLRSKSLTDISEGLASEELEPHPLKTFVNISSGRLENMDKLIITTDTIFNIFSLEEIKKSALRFSAEKFVQFLKTALGNELEKAAVLIVDLKEKEESYQPFYAEKEPVNAFSSTSFSKSSRKNAGDIPKTEALKQPVFPEKNAGENTEKTNHLYIKATEKVMPEQKRFAEFFFAVSEIAGALWKKIAKISRTTFSFFSNLIKNIPRPLPKISAPAPTVITEKIITPESERLNLFRSLRFSLSISSAAANLKKISLFLLPSFSRLKKINARLNYQQRLYVALVVLLIVFVPLIALRIQKNIQTKTVAPVAEVPKIVLPLKQDKNVSRVENLNVVFAGENLSGVINLGGKFFALMPAEIVSLESQERFALPADFGKTKLATGMDDLNLIFFINSGNKLISWSPVSKKFNTETIILPENSNITTAGTYLTYLYLVDGKNNQIYRYPRAGEGFGAAANWLKDTLDLSQISSVALSDNIFAANGATIVKMFKGKKVDFNLESSATPIAPAKVWTKPDSQNLYLLDTKNSRIVKLDINGNIISQYYNFEIGSASGFAIDETNSTAYFATPNNIFSFVLN
jgi:serine/threonine protein phosphatase PrpC